MYGLFWEILVLSGGGTEVITGCNGSKGGSPNGTIAGGSG